MNAARMIVGFLRRGESRRAVLALVGGTTLAQAVVVLSSPVLTRLYDPVAFGEYSVAIAIIALLSSISCLAYHYAIPLPADDVDAASLLVLCFVNITFFCGLTVLVLLVAGGNLLSLAGVGSLASVALLLSVGQGASAAVAALRQWAVRTKSFSLLAINSVVQSSTLVGSQLLLGAAGLGTIGLLAGSVLGTMAGSSRLARAAWGDHAPAFQSVTWSRMLRAAHRYRRFAILSTPSVVLNTLGLRAPVLLLVAIYGAGAGGQFALAERIIALPVTLVAGSVDQVFLAQAARLARTDLRAVHNLFLRASVSLAALAIGPAIAAVLIAPLAFGLVFGEAWEEAGMYVALLAPWFFVYLVASPTGGLLDVLERQDLHLLREILRLLIVIGAALVMVALALSPREAVAMISLAGILTHGTYWCISLFAIHTSRKHRSDSGSDDKGVEAGTRGHPLG